MKVKAALISIMTTLLLSGNPVDLSKVYVEPTGNYDEDILTLGELHLETATHFLDLNDAILDDTGIVVNVDTIDQMTINEANRDLYKQENEQLSNKLYQALDTSNKALIATVNFNTMLNSLQTTGSAAPGENVSSPQFIPIIAAGVLGGAAAYGFLIKVMGAVDKSQNIVNDVAANNEADRIKVVEIMQARNVNISDSATPQQIKTTYQGLGMKERQHIVNDVRGYNTDQVIYNPADTSHATIAENDKQALVDATVELGGVAVEANVFAYTSVTGSLGGLLNNKYLGAGIDLATGLTQTDPLGLLGRSLRITATSQVQNTMPMSASSVSGEEAFLTFAELEVLGVDDLTFGEIDGALGSYGSSLAQNDGDGDDLTLTYPRYTFFQDIPLTEDPGDPNSWLGKLQLPEDLYDYLFEFTITNLEGLLKILESIRPGDETDIHLQRINDIICLKKEKEVNGTCEPMNCIGDSYNCPDCSGDYVFYDYDGNAHCMSNLSSEFAYPTNCPSTGTGSTFTVEPDGTEINCIYDPADGGNISFEIVYSPDYIYEYVWHWHNWAGTGFKKVEYWIEDYDWQTPQWLQDTRPNFTFIPQLVFWFCENNELISARPTVDQGTTQHGTFVSFYEAAPGACSLQPSYIDQETNGVKDGKEMHFDPGGTMTSCTLWVNGVNTGSCL